MKKKMNNITILIIGIVIGVLLVGVPVMAGSYLSSKDVSYKTDYNENVTNVEEALDILTNQVKEINNTGTSLESDILSGKTAYVNGKLLTGSMANYGGITKSASGISESGSNALITIPGGYYDETSSISVPLNTIEELPTISSNLSNLVTGSKSLTYNYINRTKKITINTGITGYSYGLAQANFSDIVAANAVECGFGLYTSVTPSNGVITISIDDHCNALYGFNSTVTVKYVFWN